MKCPVSEKENHCIKSECTAWRNEKCDEEIALKIKDVSRSNSYHIDWRDRTI